ncbi:hypothetical protein EXU85_27990 [Spirosoma sp. KCTC 42546]|uniref:hypothetical protein n=1 Tax=Spirosoma sp. KCTC 42546 TaxID=2520506 RepID=UPI00115AB869|nr:hypothetical protein [Spirosoma sp. KCTC 42546]QDK82246.1 hypothetical protein EXU85_27990 [Spirosoma sp. KCTC 42546]
MSFRWVSFFLLLALSASAQKPIPPSFHPDPTGALKTYQESLAKLRLQHPNHRELPDLKFFLFGMGDRLKLIYRRGRLLNALTGNIEEQWRVKQEIIVPSEYLVQLTLTDGQTIQLREDETGVWLLQTGRRPKLIPGTRSRLILPTFANHPLGPVLRVLHQEILINIINGRPVPNFLVYFKPRFRDAAIMAMVLRETNNLPLIHDWIMAIRDPFDRTNHGVPEADNLGEVLFLVSLVSDKTHPAVQMVLDSVRQFQKETYIIGKTDDAEHPVFQTKWLKYGLKSLGLPDTYTIPKQTDSYSSLFWLDYKRELTGEKRFEERLSVNSPYLAWAEDHFYGEKRGMVSSLDYPLSWEQQASNAHYPGLTVLDKEFVKQKLAFPNAWHAAEMFLLLLEK